jgi:hypothetical protein
VEQEKKLLPLRHELMMKQHESTKEWQLRRDKELQNQQFEENVALMKARWREASTFFSGDRLAHFGVLGAGLFAAFFSAKSVYPTAKRAVHDFFFRPTLLSKLETPLVEAQFGGSLARQLDVVAQARNAKQNKKT